MTPFAATRRRAQVSLRALLVGAAIATLVSQGCDVTASPSLSADQSVPRPLETAITPDPSAPVAGPDTSGAPAPSVEAAPLHGNPQLDHPINLEVRADCGYCGEDSWLWELPWFRLYANGSVLFRDDEPDQRFTPYHYAVLPPEQRDALLLWALNGGGLRVADSRYLGDADDCPGTTFGIDAEYLDEAANKTVWLQQMCAGPVDEHGVRDQLQQLATTLRDFEAWLRERGLESVVFEPSAYTAAMIWPARGKTIEPWPWDDVHLSDFADTRQFGPRLARLTPAQALEVAAVPGGGRVGTLGSSPGMVSSVYVRPVLPGDDLPGAFGLRPDTVAVTVTDRLRVRSLPEVSDASAKLEPVLRKGDALYVVGGPVDGSGYRWYQVYTPRVELGGWVAWADKTGAPWIEGRPIECTIGASDDALVGEIGYSLMHLACFKGQPFAGERVLAVAAPGDGIRCGDVWSYELDPQWLNSPLICTYEFGPREADTGSFDLISHGVLHVTVAHAARALLEASADPVAGVLVHVVGQLDHPDARRCTAAGTEPPSPIEATLECRRVFVITEIRPAAE